MADITETPHVVKAEAIAEPTKDAAEVHYWGGWGFDGLTDDVWEERLRQLEKRGVQERASGNSFTQWGMAERTAKKQYAEALAKGSVTWLDILKEEVYEAFAAPDIENLREELVQVMAVAASWILDLDRRQTTDAPVNPEQDAADAIEAAA